FMEVLILELFPFRRIVAEPFPECGTRSRIPHPEVDRCTFLPHASRPEPFDQDTETIFAIGRFIDAVCPDHSSTLSNWSLLAPHSGQTQSSGRSSNDAPGGIPPSGSPILGS